MINDVTVIIVVMQLIRGVVIAALVPQLAFEMISYSFGIIFRTQTQEHDKTIKTLSGD